MTLCQALDVDTLGDLMEKGRVNDTTPASAPMKTTVTLLLAHGGPTMVVSATAFFSSLEEPPTTRKETETT